jgi:hypothetical protein
MGQLGTLRMLGVRMSFSSKFKIVSRFEDSQQGELMFVIVIYLPIMQLWYSNLGDALAACSFSDSIIVSLIVSGL